MDSAYDHSSGITNLVLISQDVHGTMIIERVMNNVGFTHNEYFSV